jgi:hypothetical protein
MQIKGGATHGEDGDQIGIEPLMTTVKAHVVH